MFDSYFSFFLLFSFSLVSSVYPLNHPLTLLTSTSSPLPLHRPACQQSPYTFRLGVQLLIEWFPRRYVSICTGIQISVRSCHLHAGAPITRTQRNSTRQTVMSLAKTARRSMASTMSRSPTAPGTLTSSRPLLYVTSSYRSTSY